MSVKVAKMITISYRGMFKFKCNIVQYYSCMTKWALNHASRVVLPQRQGLRNPLGLVTDCTMTKFESPIGCLTVECSLNIDLLWSADVVLLDFADVYTLYPHRSLYSQKLARRYVEMLVTELVTRLTDEVDCWWHICSVRVYQVVEVWWRLTVECKSYNWLEKIF